MPLDHFYYDYRVYSKYELKKSWINIKENIYKYEVDYKYHLWLFPILTYSSWANNTFFNPEKGYTFLWQEENVKLVFKDLWYPTKERYFWLSIYIDGKKLEEVSYDWNFFPEYIDTSNIVFDKNLSSNINYNRDIYFHDGNHIYCLRGLIKKENLDINKFDTYDFSKSKDCELPF